MLNLSLTLLTVICVLVAVAFFTLFERKLLGYIQIRKGPNKTGFMGLLQPFADAIKLFSKEHVAPISSNYLPFIVAPVASFFLALLIWSCIPSKYSNVPFKLGVMFFLVCTALNVYGLLAAGWSSNSKYALLGALRGVAQTISYEVSLALTLLSPLLITQSFDMANLAEAQETMYFIVVLPILSLIWFASCLAETNRTPFDFAEGESELVSGYNTEYASGGFALIMLAEYTSILFMSMLFVILYLGGSTSGLGIVWFTLVAFTFVWVRGTLPRMRYDKLMSLAWKTFLPISLIFLVLVSALILT
uniref:NADH-ubiquinone oxidoreductase chain 1 n=1 Tax=Diaphanosoma dubium TaxID=743458 RepID=A0A343VVM1_9CRUS|nr:NADH dehydrogenase subunit 1 [Diaphanosoma dubium]AVP74686.1 NADH dehydrogenase subunit 1 [Diaphanosoma dubium]